MEDPSEEIYSNLIGFCNTRCETFGVSQPIFEPVEVFSRCCMDLRREHLISIENEDEFVRACFLKVLDNVGSRYWEKMAGTPLKLGVLTRDGFIDRLIKSPEFTNKGTVFEFFGTGK